MTPVSVIQGDSPLILAQPHSGTFVPKNIWSELTQLGRQLVDTDWHIPTLYEGLASSATVVQANFSRYVIDANRNPSGTSLYPGQNTTGLVPLIRFDEETIWRKPPSEAEISTRLEAFHQPYHTSLKYELERVRRQHGFAILYDCHSIRSELPYLFEGRLPDLNIGTYDGASCAASITKSVMRVCETQSAYTHTLNGRFKGGWTTRRYGQPEQHIHAIQMEISQRTYLASEAPPFTYDSAAATPLRAVLRDILSAIETTAQAHFPKETNRGQAT